MVTYQSGTAGTAFLNLYAHAGVTHYIGVGKSRNIRNLEFSNYLSRLEQTNSLVYLFSVANLVSNQVANLVSTNPVILSISTSWRFTLHG